MLSIGLRLHFRRRRVCVVLGAKKDVGEVLRRKRGNRRQASGSRLSREACLAGDFPYISFRLVFEPFFLV